MNLKKRLIKLLLLSVILFLGLQSFGQINARTQKEIQLLLQEKNSRTPTQQKIDSRLLQAVRENRGEKMVKGVDLDPVDVRANFAGILKVDIKGEITDEFLAKIKALGGTIIYAAPQYHTVRASINLKGVETIAGYREVQFVEPAVRSMVVDAPRKELNNKVSFAERAARVRAKLSAYLKSQGALIGKINSQGDTAHRAADVRKTYGYLGAGIKVGVLSDSYNATGGAAADVTSGDLPGTGNPDGYTTPVTVVQDDASGADEGRAMLQVIHDLAPAAILYFATADVSEAGFASNILALRNTYGCNIILDDVGYFDEPAFQDGITAQAVNTVTAAGALYFSAAGNSGSLVKGTSGVFEGDFNDAGSVTFAGSTKAGTVHNFGTVSAPVNGDIIKAVGEVYNLNWSDPWGASTNDYDLFLVSSAGKVKGSSTNVQTGTQNPYEQVTAKALVSGDRLVVFKATAAAVRAIHLNTNRGTLTVATNGQTTGHACAVSAFCMAATPAAAAFESGYPVGPYPSAFVATNKVEPFSSDGPRRMFYNADGSAITSGNVLFGTNGGTSLAKPDLTAADGVSTTLGSSTGLNPFYGTSCAAPHAGAIAALLLSANPSLTPAQVRSILTSTALDVESTGYDNVSGYGIIQAFQAAGQVNATGCAVPTGLTPSNITTTSATAGWTAVSGANSYTLQYKASTASSYTAVTGITTNSYGLTGLTASTKYYFEVLTVCSSGSSVYSAIDSFTTSAAATCTVPTALTSSAITTTTATVGWAAVAGAASYTLQYKISTASIFTTVTGITTNSYPLTGLTASTGYTFQVLTVCSGTSSSAYSTPATFTTAAVVGTCNAPTGLTSGSITTTSATLGWTAVTGAASYTLQYKVTTASTFTTVTGITTNSYGLSGLTAGTGYTFQVLTVCSGTSSSAYSTPATFTTSAGTVTYCASKGTTTYEYIKTVVLGSINHTTTNDGGYGNFTTTSTNLTAGSSYTITLTPGFTSTKYAETWTVYIDYNIDGTLNGTGETVVSAKSTRTGSATGTFTVPSGAKNGSTRMRIQMSYSTASTNPCATITYGDVQDYTVNISGGTGSGITEESSSLFQDNSTEPERFNTLSVVPNPMSGSTATATYNLAKDGNVTIRIIDLSGRVLHNVPLGAQSAGSHNYQLNNLRSKLRSGYYVIVLEQDNQIISRNRFIVNQ
jgi:GEVED domain-containing protein/subtilase family protein/fibronectin type III domain protein